METNVNYTIVGAFVIALFAAMVFGIIWLSAGFSSEHQTIYKVYMAESVSGLNIDSSVEYNGVNIGNVADIDIDHKNPHLIILLLKIKSNTPITMGTRATLNSRGLTGTAYVALQDLGHDIRPLEIEKGEDYPVIKTSPSFYMRLDTALKQVTTDIHLFSRSIQMMLNPSNQQAFKQTLSNLQSITNTLMLNSQQMNNILQNSAKASERLPTLIDDFSDLATEIKQNPSLLVRGRVQQTLGPGE